MSKMPKRLMTAATMRQITEKAKRHIEIEEKAKQAEREEVLRVAREGAIRRTAPRLLVNFLDRIHAEALKGNGMTHLEAPNRPHTLAVMSYVATRLQELGYRVSTIAGQMDLPPEHVQGVQKVKRYTMSVWWNEKEEQPLDEFEERY